MRYRINYHQLPNGSIEASCPDVPEFFCVQPSIEKTRREILRALPAAMHKFYRKKRLPIPLPAAGKSDDRVALPVRIQAKILLWNMMLAERWRLADIARELHIAQAQAQRLVDLDRDLASMEAIEQALDVMGAEFTLRITRNTKR